MKKIKIEVTNVLKVSGELPYSVLRKLEERLIFPNPAYESAEKFGRYTHGIPEKLSFIETSNGVTTIPRGFISQLKKILDFNGVPFLFRNRTRLLPQVDFVFRGKLHGYQREAVETMTQKNFGVLQSPTGSGKTVMCLAIIAARRQPSLIIVHTRELLYQWQQRIEQFLGIPLEEIGLIGDGHTFDETKKITVGIVNSLKKCADYVKDYIGHLIVDECHKIAAKSFTEVASTFDCAYSLGLSATPFRRDGLTKLIFFFIGDRRHTIDTGELQKKSFILKPELRTVETDFFYDYQDDYVQMIGGLVEDEDRNELIANEVVEHAANGQGVSLIISDRKNHCAEFFRLLVERGIRARLLTGSVGSEERRKIVQEIEAGTVQVVCATASLISEGFDAKSLSAIFLTVPVGSSGKLIQSIGRIVRTASGKRGAVIYDYHDSCIGILTASYRRRLRTYQGLGINVESEILSAV